MEMLSHDRHADLERRAARRRQNSLLATCRRTLLGLILIQQARTPCRPA